MTSPSASPSKLAQDLNAKLVQPVKNLVEDVSDKLAKGAQQLSEKTSAFLASFKDVPKQTDPERSKTYHLKKTSNKASESTNNKFESLFNAKKFKEAMEFFMEENNHSEIKTYSFNSFIDKLSDAGQVAIFTDLLTFSIQNKIPVLTKYTMKKYFALLAKVNKTNLGQNILNLYLNSLGENDSKELLYRIYQYYISASLKAGDLSTALNLFNTFKTEYSFSEETSSVYYKIYEILIKGCINIDKGNLEKAKLLLEEVAAHKPNDVFFNKLIDFSAKHNDLSFSEYIFKVMVSHTIQPSIVTYNTLIDSYFKQNKYNQAWILFELLKKSDKKPDNFTYTTMINGIKSMEKPDLNKAFQLFNEYKEINKPDQIIYNCLMDACINAGNFDRAYQLLDEMKKDPTLKLDEITFNTLIKGCCKTKKLYQAIGLYEEMKKINVKPNRITFNSLIDTCVKTGKMGEAWKFYEEMTKCDIVPDNFTYSILINGIKSNHHNKDELNRALSMLDVIQNSPDFTPDEIFYNSLIDACVKFNEINKGLSVFEEMKKKKIEPSSITYGILIKAFGKINDLVKAFKIFEQMKLKHMKINDVTYGCLLDACVKNDRMDLALILVDKMKQDNISLNTILYTTLIKGFSKVNKLDEALNIFNIMKENPRTYPNLITYNCMIDACVKCDNMIKALEIFEEMTNGNRAIYPDLITYSTMIKGFCKQKNIEKAYHFLNLILNNKITPDEALINLLLECCYSTGNIDRGVEIFNIMNSLKIPASNITYSILIKLYGKGRKINKAMGVLEIMKKNKVKPGLITYTNLIQACFKAKKVEYVLDVLKDLESHNLKLDNIFYSKVISGFLSFKRVDLAAKYIRNSFTDRIHLGAELYNNAVQALTESDLPDKEELIQMIQKSIKHKGKQNEPTLRENNTVLNKQPHNQNTQQTQENAKTEDGNSQFKKKFFNKRKDNKENSGNTNTQFVNKFLPNEEKKANEVEPETVQAPGANDENNPLKESNKENSQKPGPKPFKQKIFNKENAQVTGDGWAKNPNFNKSKFR